MKHFLICLLLIVAASKGFAQTQGEMNRKANEAYREADKKLNEVYQLIQKDYAANKKFIENMKVAQRLWIQFRDAQVEMMFPEPAKSYGSMFPVCKANYLTELTTQRMESLRIWINGLPPGETCTGSVGAKQ
ncbi:lysozyme inhibitor LprI family protein [Chitinophaga sp. Hz27]|uniref:lysozyme inhibitor LprI family protein n=1 Tax=Chitinophaga sp. Hz27 TaxID=3347169 RepID=UPI0035DD5B86